MRFGDVRNIGKEKKAERKVSNLVLVDNGRAGQKMPGKRLLLLIFVVNYSQIFTHSASAEMGTNFIIILIRKWA